jgi:hypothetical protein
MSKRVSLVLLFSCALVGAGALTACSTGALPGGSAAAPGSASAPTKPAQNAAAVGDDLIAVPKDCPKGSEVSALVGFTVPDASEGRSSQGLACSYVGTSTANIVEINFYSTRPGTTAASVKAELDAQNSEGAIIAPVPGLGDAAYSGTIPTGGVALLVWNKGVEFSVVDAHDVDGLRRLALGILAG